MLAPRNISDPDVLRQIIELQNRELERLTRRLTELSARVAQLEGRSPDEALQLELASVSEQLERLRRQQFGPRSERRGRGEDGASDSASKDPGGPRRGHGPRAQPDLPLLDEHHVLDEADLGCPKCGLPLETMKGQVETSEQITVVKRQYVLVRHHRQKYRCRCNGCVETALGPQPLKKGGRYSVAFGAHVAVAKFADHIPLERQVRQMARAGLAIDSTTLFDQLVAVAHYLRPTWEALRAHILSQPSVRVDETPWKMLGRGRAKTWWAWCMATHEAVVFDLKDTRSRRGADELLGDYRGVVLADGHKAYADLEKQRYERDGASFTLAQCWVHARRKLLEAQKGHPGEVAPFLDDIAQLYAIERQAKELVRAGSADRSARDIRADLLERRRVLRPERAGPIIERIRARLQTTAALPRSSLGTALAYIHQRWDGLTVFLNHPDVELDTNEVERAIRGPVVGRNNFRGTASKRGAWVSSVLYSLTQTAALHGLDPEAWIVEIIRRSQALPSADDRGVVILPWDFLKS